ncbi:hypothetical protein CCR75_000523 [Bremia lactucae]|uniref:Uncharacterized protein n=1 Tax=Bremia lactucae TaxID=4779 RepID=A0A976IK03_BRELC|nr:hypothetical protein CCR75_000523 [Bremia lactucae]
MDSDKSSFNAGISANSDTRQNWLNYSTDYRNYSRSTERLGTVPSHSESDQRRCLSTRAYDDVCISTKLRDMPNSRRGRPRLPHQQLRLADPSFTRNNLLPIQQ